MSAADIPRGVAIGPAEHGQGAFASAPHAKGDLLGIYTGELLDAAAAAARPNKSYQYILREGPRRARDFVAHIVGRRLEIRIEVEFNRDVARSLARAR